MQKPHKQQKKQPMHRRVLWPVCAVLAAQLFVVVGGIYFGGVVQGLNDYAGQLLQSSVDVRAGYLETEMITRWSSLGDTVAELNELYAEMAQSGLYDMEHLDTDEAAYSEFLKQAGPALVRTLRTNGVTGAFVALYKGEMKNDLNRPDERRAGLYLRDRDPDSDYSAANGDLLLERAPLAVARSMGISTDSGWRPLFIYEGNAPFDDPVYKPYTAAYENPRLSYLDCAYWSSAFSITDNSARAIGYSVPLIAPDGTLYGVLGVDLLVDYLATRLPYAELGDGVTSAYILAIDRGGETLQNAFVSGNGYLRYADEKTTQLAPFARTGLYTVQNQTSGQRLDAAMHPLYLYNSNTPHAGDRWVLLAVEPHASLFELSSKTVTVVGLIVVFMLATGALSVMLITHYVASPVTLLAKDVRRHVCAAETGVTLCRTEVKEVDELAAAVEDLSFELYRTGAQFTKIMEMASVSIGGFVADLGENRLFVNEKFFSAFGRPELDARSMTPQQFGATIQSFIPSAVSENVTKTETQMEGVYEMSDAGVSRWVRLHVERENAVWTGFVEDVTSQQRELRKVAYERDHDVLTGLYNRRAFNRIMEKLFQEQPSALKCAALLMMDLDDLKYLNDTYGHDSGDNYIFASAGALQSGSPEGTLVARMSGDEFLLFFYGYDTHAEIRTHIKALQKSFFSKTLTLPGGTQYPLRGSAGVAWYPQDSTVYTDLVRYADFAMYKIKHSRKGEFIDFDLASYQREAYLLQGKAALHELIEKQLVEYHFQPIVEAHTAKVFAVEALMRPCGTVLKTPAEVLTLARQESCLGQIETLTWFSAAKAFVRQCEQKHVDAACRLFINSLADQIMSDAQVADFERQYAFYLHRIVKEHTEEDRTNSEFQQRKAEYLRRWGGQIALDDYGSGYSNDRSLLQFSPDFVKVDISIVSCVDTDDNKRQMVENLVHYCHPRGIKVIAEGVETAGEASVLVRLGVDYLQGYFIARPAPSVSAVRGEAMALLRQLAAQSAEPVPAAETAQKETAK